MMEYGTRNWKGCGTKIPHQLNRDNRQQSLIALHSIVPPAVYVVLSF